MIKAHAIIDLGFGDSGKGKCVDWLASTLPDSRCVIRFNGGSQAAHNVVRPDGFSHTFSQFGSGTFFDKSTYLTSYVSIDPIAILAEHQHLSEYLKKNILDKLYINLDCKVITPYHRALNRFKEIRRGDLKHGSCGVGYGECISLDLEYPELTLYYRDLVNPNIITTKFKKLREHILKEYPYIVDFDDFRGIGEILDDIISDYQYVYDKTVSIDDLIEYNILIVNDNIFEGAQGVLLDENYGLNPYTTWSTCTDANIRELYKKHNIECDLESIGIFRAFPTRHGKGPFPSENPYLINAISDDHNRPNEWQDNLRVGILDLPLLQYAASKCNLTSFIMTHYDKLSTHNDVIMSYDISLPEVTNFKESTILTKCLENICENIEEVSNHVSLEPSEIIQVVFTTLSIPCKNISTGPTNKDMLVNDN